MRCDRYDSHPVSALQGLAPDHVVFLGTTAKTLAPALRIAWILEEMRRQVAELYILEQEEFGAAGAAIEPDFA